MAKRFLAHHGVLGMKWGVRKYQNENGRRTPAGKERMKTLRKVASNADILAKEAASKEPGITRTVLSSGKKMHGLENRLKTVSSIRRKILNEVDEDGKTIESATKSIRDAVRYTVLSDDNSFTNDYDQFKRHMESKGYNEVRCKNYFDLYSKGLAKHKSVQSVYADPDGYLFEVQFQTPASQCAKDLKVPIYEERRKTGIPKERADILEKKMVDLAESVPTPRGVETIKSHNDI
jgi:hypothetical protein